MTLLDLINRAKLEIPSARAGVTDNELKSLFNAACDQVNVYAEIHKGYTDFDITADKQLYSISTIAPNYLGATWLPVYFKDSDGKWQEVYPKSKKWVAKSFRNWLNGSSVGLPDWYWNEGDELGFYNKPSTTYVDGGRLYHLKKAVGMSNDGDFPWSGSTTEISAFKPMDDALIAYVKHKLSPAYGKVTDSSLTFREFIAETKRAARQIKRRPDKIVDNVNGVFT